MVTLTGSPQSSGSWYQEPAWPPSGPWFSFTWAQEGRGVEASSVPVHSLLKVVLAYIVTLALEPGSSCSSMGCYQLTSSEIQTKEFTRIWWTIACKKSCPLTRMSRNYYRNYQEIIVLKKFWAVSWKSNSTDFPEFLKKPQLINVFRRS